jgi:hypothetical protein
MSTQNYKDRMSELFGKLEGDSADGDPAYQAGADEINTPIDTGPDMDDEVADSLSTESEDIHEGSTSTTAYYKRKMNDLFGKLESDDETGGGDSAADDPAYNAGADKIDTPIDTGPDMDDEVADSLSTESEDIHEGSTATTAYYKNEMKKLFGKLDGNVYPGMEGIGLTGTELWKTVRDSWMREFSALRRWVQSLTQGDENAVHTLQVAKAKLSKYKFSDEITAHAYTPDAANTWLRSNPSKAIDNALKALADLQSASFKETISDQYDAIADSLDTDIDKVESAEPHRTRVTADEWKPAELVKVIDGCLELAKTLQKANATYKGWWETGYSQGKLPAIFSGTPIGSLISSGMLLTTHRNVLRIARTGWRNINTTSAISVEFIRGIANLCAAIMDEAD